MTRLSIALCSLVLAALPSSSALADTLIFDFSFSNADYSASGTLTAMSTSTAGEYLVTGATGNVFVDGQTDAITGVIKAGNFPTDGPNNNELFFPELKAPEGAFDASGVSLNFDGGKLNMFLNDGEDLKLTGGKQDEQLGMISVAPVPEPGTLALLGTGVLGAAGAIRRRISA